MSGFRFLVVEDFVGVRWGVSPGEAGAEVRVIAHRAGERGQDLQVPLALVGRSGEQHHAPHRLAIGRLDLRDRATAWRLLGVGSLLAVPTAPRAAA